jgi:hypothetical protein
MPTPEQLHGGSRLNKPQCTNDQDKAPVAPGSGWEGTQPRDLWLEDHYSSRTCENWTDFVNVPGPHVGNSF